MASSRLALKLSPAIRKTATPIIPLARTWAASYAQTKDHPLLDLTQGVPGTVPPTELLQAIATASQDPANTTYGPVIGEPSMRAALVQEMKTVYGSEADLTPDDVVMTAGCNMAFSAAVLAIATAGDEVILPVPWYFNHPMTLDMLGMIPVPLYTNSKTKYLPTVEECEKLITNKTRAIALVTPNNPTGAIYTPSLLQRFGTLARSAGVALIIDETYRDMLISSQPPHDLFTQTAEWSWRSSVIHLFSFSKSYCLPGHRLGAIVAPGEVITQIKKFLDNVQICPPVPPQKALPPLLSSLRPFINSCANAIASRQKLFKSVLPRGWTILSQGGYYAWVRHPYLGVDAEVVCRVLAKEFGVVCLPSSGFRPAPAGDPAGEEDFYGEGGECIRFSVANITDEKIRMLGMRLEKIGDILGERVRSESVDD